MQCNPPLHAVAAALRLWGDNCDVIMNNWQLVYNCVIYTYGTLDALPSRDLGETTGMWEWTADNLFVFYIKRDNESTPVKGGHWIQLHQSNALFLVSYVLLTASGYTITFKNCLHTLKKNKGKAEEENIHFRQNLLGA